MSPVKATFAAGCFWGVEEAFRKLEGVVDTRVGYTGGTLKDPVYEDVLTDRTGHAEAVEVLFDETVISYREMLKAFFQLHNPSTMPGEKYKYRSAIFYHSPQQHSEAAAFLEALKAAKLFDLSIKTTIVPAGAFYVAEAYHQRYYEKQGII